MDYGEQGSRIGGRIRLCPGAELSEFALTLGV
jgi:hypothetical protein